MFPKRDHSSRCTSVLKSWLECCNTFEWLISWQFLLFDSPSFSLTPRNITKVQTTNTPPITPAAIMYTSFCKEKERWETISFHFTQPAQSSLFLAFSPSLIHRCFKRLKNWSSSFQHARRPLWSQTARGRLSFYPTPGCFFYLLFSVLSISTLIPALLIACEFLCCFPHRHKDERCHALIYKYKRKQEETSSWSTSLKYSLNPFKSPRDRNRAALNNLCLFATFPCGSAQWSIIIYAHRTLPVSSWRPGLLRQCATLTSDHGGI